MKIGIIGRGFVGGAILAGFENQGHEVLVHDTKLNTKIEDVIEAPLLYICVPTPSTEDGSCNTNIVESVLGQLSELDYEGTSTSTDATQKATAVSASYTMGSMAFAATRTDIDNDSGNSAHDGDGYEVNLVFSF